MLKTIHPSRQLKKSMPYTARQVSVSTFFLFLARKKLGPDPHNQVRMHFHADCPYAQPLRYQLRKALSNFKEISGPRNAPDVVISKRRTLDSSLKPHPRFPSPERPNPERKISSTSDDDIGLENACALDEPNSLNSRMLYRMTRQKLRRSSKKGQARSSQCSMLSDQSSVPLAPSVPQTLSSCCSSAPLAPSAPQTLGSYCF